MCAYVCVLVCMCMCVSVYVCMCVYMYVCVRTLCNQYKAAFHIMAMNTVAHDQQCGVRI